LARQFAVSEVDEEDDRPKPQKVSTKFGSQ